MTSAMKVLTLAARRGGVSGVVAELAHRIDGWAVLLDRHGQVITTAGAGGLHVQDAVAVALGRPVRVRHRSLQVHAVGPGEDLSAQLIVSPRTESSSRARELGSQTAALLDLVLRTDDPTRTERLGRGVLMEVLLAGGEPAASLLRRWGVHETTLTAFALTARSASVDVERLVSLWLNELGAAHILTQAQGVVTGFLRDDHVDEVGARVEAYSSALFLGVGVSAPTDALASSSSEAAQALEAAPSRRSPSCSTGCPRRTTAASPACSTRSATPQACTATCSRHCASSSPRTAPGVRRPTGSASTGRPWRRGCSASRGWWACPWPTPTTARPPGSPFEPYAADPWPRWCEGGPPAVDARRDPPRLRI